MNQERRKFFSQCLHTVHLQSFSVSLESSDPFVPLEPGLRAFAATMAIELFDCFELCGGLCFLLLLFSLHSWCV